MKRSGRWFGILLTICMVMMISAEAITAYAASPKKSIGKITIDVKLKLAAGDSLPDVSAGDRGSGCEVEAGSEHYTADEAKWVSSTNKDVTIGSTYTLKVYLTAKNSDEYGFNGTYKSSNVTVKGGTFVSASRQNYETLIVTIKTKPVEGEFEAPSEAYWKENQLGTAVWEKVDDVSAYDITLYRGSSTVYKVTSYKGATKLNFYPYMTSAGTYSFKVRSVAQSTTQKDYAKNSEWTESDEIYIAKESVSNGSGKVDYNSGNNANTGNPGNPGNGGNPGGANNAAAGWIQSNNRWSYHYPDGSYQKNSWLQVNNVWYLFDSDGWMMTGWQQKDGFWYYLDGSGAMRTGWIKAANGWYFLNPGPVQGPMWQNQWLDWNGKRYFLSETGVMAEGWKEIGGKWYYFAPGEGSMAVNTMINTFYVGADGAWSR